MAIDPGETIEAAGIPIQAYPAQHGPLVRLFGRAISLKPWFVGVGAISLLFTLNGQRLLNLGDTTLLSVWEGLQPDVLMIPIGGLMTMDVDGAIKAIEGIVPEVVIPVHYNWDFLFYHRPADGERFAAEVSARGHRCCLLKPGESVEL